MTDQKDSPGKRGGAGKSGDQDAAKRPHATIDLKAVEVTTRAASPAQSSPGTKPASQPAAPAAQAVAQAPAQPAAAKSDGLPAARPPVPAMPRPQGEAARKVAAAAAAAKADASGTAKPASATSSANPKAGPAAAGNPPGSRVPSPQPTPPPSRETATPPRRRSSSGNFLSHALAGLVGAAVALVAAPHVEPQLAPLLGAIGLPAPPPPPVSPEVMQRLGALESTIAGKPGSTDANGITAAVKSNSQRLDELTRKLAATTSAAERAAAAGNAIETRLAKQPPIADVGERLVKLEQLLADLGAAAKAQPDSAGRIPQLAQMTSRIADIEAVLETRIAAARKDVLAQVDARVAAANEASESARTGSQRLDREVSGLKTETDRLVVGLDQIKTQNERLALGLKSAQDDAANLGATLDGMRREVNARLSATARPSDVTTAIAPLAARLSSLQQSVTGVVKSEDERKATAERIVLSLELGNLKRAMERGAPYATELAAVSRLSGTQIDLRPLEPYRASGVPTLDDLTRSFRPVADAILDADADKSDGTVLDKLMAGAKSFVRVRRTVPSPTDDGSTENIVARMEAALHAGRLADVLEEAKHLKSLPASATAWLAKVKARNTVDTALAGIDASLKAALGAGPAAGDRKGQP